MANHTILISHGKNNGKLYNPDFNYPEFEGIKNQAGLNRFVLSVKQWVEKTNSKGIVAKAWRYGGIYTHKDIAFEFATWVSPQFKLYLLKEFQGGFWEYIHNPDFKPVEFDGLIKEGAV